MDQGRVHPGMCSPGAQGENQVPYTDRVSAAKGQMSGAETWGCQQWSRIYSPNTYAWSRDWNRRVGMKRAGEKLSIGKGV